MAFHPRYASNRFVFVCFSDPTYDTAVERHHVRADDPRRLNDLAPQRILKIPHRGLGNDEGVVRGGCAKRERELYPMAEAGGCSGSCGR
jgi:hypothetical protein